MGFFDKILKGLGFDDEGEIKPKKQKKEKKQKSEKINASFDLKKEEESSEIYEDDLKHEEKIEQLENNNTTNSSFEIIKVTNQVEVQDVVTKLKNGDKVLVNMTALSSQDLTRSMDFLTGAVFALGFSMQKIEESIFLIQ